MILLIVFSINTPRVAAADFHDPITLGYYEATPSAADGLTLETNLKSNDCETTVDVISAYRLTHDY
jgi:hypothetical protein